MEEATFGAGCFWCVEAVFSELEGVQEVYPGYAGGHVKRPAYKEVCMGTTGHAEVARVKFDPAVISYEKLLEVFWFVHDPTTLNRQGNDVGTQYRSIVFYHNDKQKELAEKYKQRLNEEGAFQDPVVTEITELNNFYEAEANHRDYYLNNPDQPYCRAVVRPKVEKFKTAFSDQLKEKSKTT